VADDITLSDKDEVEFRKQFKERADKIGISSNPDAPQHLYRNRAAFLALKRDKLRFADQDHLPGKFKLPGHPTQFKRLIRRNEIEGDVFGAGASDIDLFITDPSEFINTITGKTATSKDFKDASIQRSIFRGE
jgi:hypothetical protein